LVSAPCCNLLLKGMPRPPPEETHTSASILKVMVSRRLFPLPPTYWQFRVARLSFCTPHPRWYNDYPRRHHYSPHGNSLLRVTRAPPDSLQVVVQSRRNSAVTHIFRAHRAKDSSAITVRT